MSIDYVYEAHNLRTVRCAICAKSHPHRIYTRRNKDPIFVPTVPYKSVFTAGTKAPRRQIAHSTPRQIKKTYVYAFFPFDVVDGQLNARAVVNYVAVGCERTGLHAHVAQQLSLFQVGDNDEAREDREASARTRSNWA